MANLLTRIIAMENEKRANNRLYSLHYSKDIKYNILDPFLEIIYLVQFFIITQKKRMLLIKFGDN